MITEIAMPTYILFEISGVMMSLLIGMSAFMPGLDKRSRCFFVSFFSTLALNGLLFTFDIVTYMDPRMLPLSKLLPLFELLLFAVPSLLSTSYMFYCCKEDIKKSVLFYAAVALFVIYCIYLTIGHFNDFFYYTSPEGRFFIKPTFYLLFIPLTAMLVIDLITLILRRDRLSRNYFYAFLFYLITVIITVMVHAMFFAIMVLNAGMFVASFILYILILTYQIDQYKHQQAAIANQSASIMVLQMRPHFIYNTMTSIYYLCRQDPEKAQQVILDFTSYLRKNFNAIVCNNTVPFPTEMEHIRAYLSVELAQFEDHLTVEYDTPHTQFKLPPLTLQPLVENAIKYGMDPDAGPLTILIRTEQTDSGSLITIKDNGPGFDPTGVFDSPNALSNIKQRLNMMCHGTITITSKPGSGTAVQIYIPER